MTMAAPERPEALTVSTSIVTAWRDTWEALRALFPPAIIAFAILIVLEIARSKAQIMPIPVLEDLLYDVAAAFLMTPYAIAVHRFIILDERTAGYRIVPGEPRFRRFFGWSLALSILSNAAGIFINVPDQPAMLTSLTALALIMMGVVVLTIVTVIVAVRSIILFPAVAVDAPGANWRRAVADTSGHAWQIFFIILGAALPMIAVAIVAASIFHVSIPGEPASGDNDLGVVFAAVLEIIMFTLAVVIASRLYERIGIRVKARS